jgi:hypothetical protein
MSRPPPKGWSDGDVRPHQDHHESCMALGRAEDKDPRRESLAREPPTHESEKRAVIGTATVWNAIDTNAGASFINRNGEAGRRRAEARSPKAAVVQSRGSERVRAYHSPRTGCFS